MHHAYRYCKFSKRPTAKASVPNCAQPLNSHETPKFVKPINTKALKISVIWKTPLPDSGCPGIEHAGMENAGSRGKRR